MKGGSAEFNGEEEVILRYRRVKMSWTKIALMLDWSGVFVVITQNRYFLVDASYCTVPKTFHDLKFFHVRRVYNVPGPNHLWHMDGHHKLIDMD
jgi:predicted nucleic acid-binding Zn finger protein